MDVNGNAGEGLLMYANGGMGGGLLMVRGAPSSLARRPSGRAPSSPE
jgi:hypothetical protein